MNQAFSRYDNHIIKTLNLYTWCNVRTFCDGIRPRDDQYFHREISKSVQALLKPFESLTNVSSESRLYSPERHILLEQCIQSTVPTKTYLQLIKEEQNFINNEVSKLDMGKESDILLAIHLEKLQSFLAYFELLYKLITTQDCRPGKDNNRVLLNSAEFCNLSFLRSVRYSYSNIPDKQIWAQIQNSQN